jgi:ribokinase
MEGQKHQICILGSANFDYFLEMNDFPKEGETIQAHNYFTNNGGKGANQAVAVGRLLGSALFCGQVGKDAGGDNLVKEMQESGVNLKYLRRLEDTPTGQAFIYLNSKGENCIVIVGGANMKYSNPITLPEEYKTAIDECELLLLQKEVPEELNLIAAKYAKSKNKIVVQDCGGRDEPFPEGLLDNVDFLSPNQTEMKRLIGDNVKDDHELQSEEIKTKFLSKHPNLKILMKLGEKGCGILTKDFFLTAKSAPHYNDKILQDYKIVDTTGAGDCCTAAFFSRYLQLFTAENKADEKSKYETCMNFANIAAFLTITKKGAMPSNPTITQVKEFASKYYKEVAF